MGPSEASKVARCAGAARSPGLMLAHLGLGADGYPRGKQLES